MSFARFLFDSYGKPVLFDVLAEKDVDVTYRVGDTVVAGIKAIIQSRSATFEQDINGDLIKVEKLTIKIDADENSCWRGVKDPQIKATFELLDHCTGIATTYAVNSAPGTGIEAISPSVCIINLIRHLGVARSFSDYRVN